MLSDIQLPNKCVVLSTSKTDEQITWENNDIWYTKRKKKDKKSDYWLYFSLGSMSRLHVLTVVVDGIEPKRLRCAEGFLKLKNPTKFRTEKESRINIRGSGKLSADHRAILRAEYCHSERFC